jgi:peptidyl-prolyl cis-trans isomerase SDCCAG10
MKAELLGINKKAPEPKKKKEKVSYLDEFKKQYAQGKALIGRRRGKEDEKTLDLLQTFKQKIFAEKTSIPQEQSSWTCDLHGMPDCESCRDTFGKEEQMSEEGWLASSLVFQKKKAANVYEPKADDYILIDPRSAPKTVYEKRDLPKKK